MIIENDGFVDERLQNAHEYDMMIKLRTMVAVDLRTNEREGVDL